MKHYNKIIRILVFLSSVQPIFTRIVSEVTDHGITLLRGSASELDEVRDSITKLLEDADNKKRKKRSVDSGGFGSLSLKELITHQIAMKIDTQFKVEFNSEFGESPGRGAYDSLAVDEQLIRTGLKKDAEEYGILPLPKSHYCRYRNPTEIDGDDSECCEGENKQCYTEAGCFCDESCYTKYGDCCTDHFVKCYQKLKLCLISIDDEKADKQAGEDQDSYNNKKNHFISNKNNGAYSAQHELEAVLQARSFGGFMEHRPTHLAPDDCCGQKPYNSDDTNDVGHHPLCCDGMLHYREQGTQCNQL